MFLQIHKNSTSRDVFFIIYLISRKYVENATLQLALVQNPLEAYCLKSQYNSWRIIYKRQLLL